MQLIIYKLSDIMHTEKDTNYDIIKLVNRITSLLDLKIWSFRERRILQISNTRGTLALKLSERKSLQKILMEYQRNCLVCDVDIEFDDSNATSDLCGYHNIYLIEKE